MAINLDDLKNRSINLILENQSPEGAYLTSPVYREYQYCWFRDSSFIAYAMLSYGQSESTRRFLQWGDRVIRSQRDRITNLIEKQKNGIPIESSELLPSRYMPDGSPHKDEFPGAQIDGFANWLWCLGEYASETGDTRGVTGMEESIRLIVRYLQAFWDRPGQDCWEENPEDIHLATLACVAGGLRRINYILAEKELNDLSQHIVRYAMKSTEELGWIPKSIGRNEVDSSALLFSSIFRLLPPESTVLKNTVARIENDLMSCGSGGVKRYLADTYYGGGEWVYTTALLALHNLRIGKTEKAEELFEWIVSLADSRGYLPEQSTLAASHPESISYWNEHWGVQQGPDLWAHAMYLIAGKELNSHVSGI